MAAVECFAIGGACQLLHVVDHVIATRGSRLFLPARKEGIIPGASNLRLPRFVGDRAARQAILSGREWTAGEPDAALLCDEVVEPGEMDRAIEPRVAALTDSGLVNATANRRTLRAGQEPLDLFREYMATYARDQASCHLSPALVHNLEVHWHARSAHHVSEPGGIMADTPFVWDDLAQYKAEGRFLDGYPDDERTFFAPRDNVHGLLVAVLGSAQHSIVVNMFGYDDDELNKIIQGKLADEKVYVQMSLDRSQASGVHEKQILASWNNDAFGNSIAIGTSSVHNAISHLKIVIVDGVYTVKGSTNWSLSGEQQQDNELSLSRNAVIAAETRAILDLNHDFMLKQMVGTKLDMTHAPGPEDPGCDAPAATRPAPGEPVPPAR